MAFEKKENKNIKVTIRFTEEEKKLIDEYINKNKYDNVSSFIRELIKKELLL
ncbi:ribbon-helix-helix protein, CopG family [Clostridium perfringens]|jgi:Arc/MetJ-type ribon-helix-helix transcriptional regulator|nr:ribbon-helix-helix protein, CopG family [Clostridium perfringens]EJT6535637.1 ribbon-helix-helix protein, CopG family [Clostridium perfringens]